VERLVHLSGLWRAGKSVRPLPSARVPLETGSAAFSARSVASGESDGLVAEEQFGVPARCHDCAMPILEREGARYPVLVPPACGSEAALIVVEDAAIAHEEAASGCGLEFAERSDAILTRHFVQSFV